MLVLVLVFVLVLGVALVLLLLLLLLLLLWRRHKAQPFHHDTLNDLLGNKKLNPSSSPPANQHHTADLRYPPINLSRAVPALSLGSVLVHQGVKKENVFAEVDVDGALVRGH